MATLLAVRRKAPGSSSSSGSAQAAATATPETEASPPESSPEPHALPEADGGAEPEPQVESEQAMPVMDLLSDTPSGDDDAYGSGSTAETGESAQPGDDTPEWEPHAAAHETEPDPLPAMTPDEPEAAEETGSVPEDDFRSFDDDPPSGDLASENAWSEPTLTAMSDAAAFEQPESTPEPEEQASAEAQLRDDEPFASFSEPAADETFLASEEPASDDPFLTPGPDTGAEQPSLQEVSANVAADHSIPEEEPFERAGRWWFKRGSELLVYNEQTGEWVPSPTPLPEHPAAGAAGAEQPEGDQSGGEEDPLPSRYGPESTATQTITDLIGAEPQHELDGDAEPQPEPAGEPTSQQGFWKCPACSAVNGSTSETCRMCFAARPAG